jgi:hypothetical protein
MSEPEQPLPSTGLSRRNVLRGSGLVALAAATGSLSSPAAAAPSAARATTATPGGPPLLSEPYLLDPSPSGIRVVWHTETAGRAHAVLIGDAVPGMTDEQALAAAIGPAAAGQGWRRTDATSVRLSRTREDAASRVPGRTYATVTERPVHRHDAVLRGLAAGDRTPYRVVSVDDRGRGTVSGAFSAAPAATEGQAVRLLLTSDHQLKAMTPANLEKVAETVGVELDGVLFAGDLVNVPDRASEWFDSATGLAFFAGLTGRGNNTLGGRTYRGAPLLQHTPLFPAIGNHEVMGRLSGGPLDTQFNDPQPREVAEQRWAAGEGAGDRETWIRANSWDTTTYEEMFPAPASREGGPKWWAATVGDVRIVSLFVTQIWRSPSPSGRGKFQEAAGDLTTPERWGYGQHIFEPIKAGSAQYDWLVRELRSPQWRNARYRVVMYHHPAHGLGDNSAPPFTDPVQTVERDPQTGAVTAVRYAYPLEDDHILRDLEPLFSEHGAHLVHNGHSHLWNRFRNAAGVHWIETSNVGNSYGAYDDSNGRNRNLPTSDDYVRQGDPGGLEPVVPTLAPLTDEAGTPLPFVASNDITVFSILDSGDGVVRSYRFDTRSPDNPVVLFDEFPLA